MPLTGPECERLTRTAPTLDSGSDGRWTASDESGYDGEDLLSDGRYMMVAGVAVDDAEADGRERQEQDAARKAGGWLSRFRTQPGQAFHRQRGQA